MIPTANGSARLSFDGTTVLAVLKASIGAPSSLPGADPAHGTFTVTVDPAAASSLAGDSAKARRAAEAEGAELSTIVERILVGSRALPLALLCIIPGKKCWNMTLDITILSRSAGNVLGACLLAAKAAIRAATVPAVTVIRRGGGTDASGGAVAQAHTDATSRSADDIDIDINDDPSAALPLAAWDARVPLAVTISRCGSCSAVDPSAAEEAAATAVVTVAFDARGRLLGTAKAGEGALAPQSLADAVEVAAAAARTLKGTFDREFVRAMGRDGDGEGEGEGA